MKRYAPILLRKFRPELFGSYPVRTVRYRIRYWWRKFMLEFCGICPDCNTVLNFTTTGRGLCPKCGK